MYHGAGWTMMLARFAMCWRDTSSTSPSSGRCGEYPPGARSSSRAGAVRPRQLHLLGRNGTRFEDAVIGRLTNEDPSIVGTYR